MRALFVSAGNPVLSVPDGDALERALGQLDLMVSLDLYVNETNRHADYVLPATTFLEREDLPLAFLGFYTTPFVAVDRSGRRARAARRARSGSVIEELSQAHRDRALQPAAAAAPRARSGVRLTPRRLVDLLLRTGPGGDLVRPAPRRAEHRASCAREPHGMVLGDAHRDRRAAREAAAPPTARAARSAPRSSRRSRGCAAERRPTRQFPLTLIGLRELRSHNSWMHNAPLLMRGGRTHAAADASRRRRRARVSRTAAWCGSRRSPARGRLP